VVAAIFIQFADPGLRDRIFANIKRTLKPGGVLILLGYTPKQLEYNTGGPGVLSHMYTAPLLRESWDDFDILQLDEYEAELNEGARHAGRSALIGMVARKR
jgi:SAM-dependent methyltransferase